jgi:hypothetical protein
MRNIRDGRLETIGKQVATYGALLTAVVGVLQFGRGVSQSIRDFEWKQAEQARTMINSLLEDEGWDAMTMLDWEEGRSYEISSGKSVVIRPADVPPALEASISNGQRTEEQRFIGDRYDRLFFLLSQLQIAIRSGLVQREDVEFPLSWYTERRLCAHKPMLLRYMAANSANETKEFFDSLASWRRCSSN